MIYPHNNSVIIYKYDVSYSSNLGSHSADPDTSSTKQTSAIALQASEECTSKIDNPPSFATSQQQQLVYMNINVVMNIAIIL